MTLQNSHMDDLRIALTVEEDSNGQRLDKVMAQATSRSAIPAEADISRTRLKQMITDGMVTLLRPGTSSLPQTITDPAFRVKHHDEIFCQMTVQKDPQPVGQDIPLVVVYEDDQVIVINKPAGMVVHPAPGNPDGTLVNALIYHCGDSLSGINGVRRPGIVHRIDKDTSGLMVAAKTDRAHHRLARQFARHSLERAYQAVVWGVPNPASGVVEGKIGRDPRNRLKMAVVPEESRRGRSATTHYKVIRRLEPKREVFYQTSRKVQQLPPSLSFVECRLETGRTHQVRVHMAHIRHPLVGDPFYGKAGSGMSKNFSAAARTALDGFNRQALHACLIGFKHPTSGEALTFEAPLPHDMACLILALEGG